LPLITKTTHGGTCSFRYVAIRIARAKEDGQVDGLIFHLVDGGISILQYAYDMIIFMEHDLEKALNMKLIICIFKELLGLKINFHKSEVFCFGKAKEAENGYIKIFGCEPGPFPFRYWDHGTEPIVAREASRGLGTEVTWMEI
jgi:hypothetical protein